MSSPLYTTKILRLAMAGAAYPRLPAPDASAELRTPVCGSRILLDAMLDDAGRIAAIGMEVHACAMGQASAGLFAASATGRDGGQMAAARDALAAWLNGTSEALPDWPGIAALAPARAYPARHSAILLPFDAARLAMAAVKISAFPEPVKAPSSHLPEEKSSPSPSAGRAGLEMNDLEANA